MPQGSRTSLFVIIIGVLIGVPVGLGGFTFHYADGFSYVSNDPKTCVNCHVMRPQFESWQASSHKTVAVCNDCHTPGNFIEKYMAKASNGFWHSWAFTTGRFKEPIEIKPHNRKLAEVSCRSCHSSFLEASSLSQHKLGEISCLKCHSQVGHNR